VLLGEFEHARLRTASPVPAEKSGGITRGGGGRGCAEKTSGSRRETASRAVDAAELREDVRVVGLEPVAETGADEVPRGRPGGALEHVVLAIEEVSRVARIGWDVGFEAGQPGEWRPRPLPAVADQVVHAPRARSLRVRAHRRGGPTLEVEIAVERTGRRRPPGDAEGRSVELRLGRQAPALPARIGTCLGEAHVDGPVAHGLERDQVEGGAVYPTVALSLPDRRMAPGFMPDPRPVLVGPEVAPIVSPVLHEAEEL